MVGLSLIALVGIATIISALPLTQVVFGLQNIHDNNDESSNDTVISSMAIVLVFVGFGAADICFDCLLIPGRALLDDLTVPTGRSDEANALFTGFQLGGRLLALLAGSSSLTTSGLFGLFKSEHNLCVDSLHRVFAFVTHTIPFHGFAQILLMHISALALL